MTSCARRSSERVVDRARYERRERRVRLLARGHRAAAHAALSEDSRLPAHVATEACSVLTRLPTPHRVTAEVVVGYLMEKFGEPWLTLSADEHSALLREASGKGLTGGALYDAVIALTARHAGATLLTRAITGPPASTALSTFRFAS